MQPTQELEALWDKMPDGEEMRKLYFSGDKNAQVLINGLASLGLDGIRKLKDFLEVLAV